MEDVTNTGANMDANSVPLKHADMVAVVKRTNLRPTVDNFLLPIFECISNSYYSISERFQDNDLSKGKIEIEIGLSPVFASIKDNGVGLNTENFDAFLTPFTGQKLRKGGKGFGRFIAFKVFDEVHYATRHKNGSKLESRAFSFDIFTTPEVKFTDIFTTFINDTGCSIRYTGLRAEFEKVVESVNPDQIVDRIIRYFLPYFVSGRMPQLRLTVDGTSYDAAERFKNLFSSELTIADKIEIDGELHDFEIGTSLSERGSLFPRHAMLLFADGRIIGSGRSLEGKIGTPSFLGKDGKSRVVIASVSGEFLNNRANTARTDVEASEEEIDLIANRVAEIVLDQQNEYKETRRSDQAKSLVSVFIRNPLLRTALKEAPSDYVRSKPMSWGAEQFVSDLALRRYRDQGRWERELEEKTKDFESLKAARDEILSHIEQENKEALASYVAHRRTIIDLAEKVIGVQENGRTSLEDVFHDIVYPRHKDSENTKFYQHNLWMLDERLAFVTYVSSDRTIHGGRRQAGDKVADLIMFEECAAFRNSDANSIVLVEFKRPGRNDYSFGDARKDPIQQVYETIAKIRTEGSLISANGTRLQVPNGTRIFSYVIADIEPTLRTVIDDHDFNISWDQQGFFRYHEKRDAFVEVFGYDKLVADAKKRNSAFFEVLMGDII